MPHTSKKMRRHRKEFIFLKRKKEKQYQKALKGNKKINFETISELLPCIEAEKRTIYNIYMEIVFMAILIPRSSQ